MIFEKDASGNYIGYHWEGGETFEISGQIPLTIDTLDSSRVLFIAPTPDVGWGDGTDRLLKVVFKVSKEWEVCTDFRSTAPTSYTRMLAFQEHTSDSPSKHYVEPGSYLAGLVNDGYNLFMLDDPAEDLPEAFITEPKKWVISIEEV